MVAQNDVDPVGIGQLVADNIVQERVGKTASVLILRAAVDNLLEQNVPVGMTGQVGKLVEDRKTI